MNTDNKILRINGTPVQQVSDWILNNTKRRTYEKHFLKVHGEEETKLIREDLETELKRREMIKNSPLYRVLKEE